MNRVRSAKCKVRGALWSALIFIAPHFAPRTSHAQSRWRPEDRTVIGEMLHIFAVASSYERLYVVSADQVLIREPGRTEWQGPFTGPGLARAQDARGVPDRRFFQSPSRQMELCGTRRRSPFLICSARAFPNGTPPRR